MLLVSLFCSVVNVVNENVAPKHFFDYGIIECLCNKRRSGRRAIGSIAPSCSHAGYLVIDTL